MFIKTGNFQMLPETTNFKVLKQKTCVMIALLSYFNSNFKLGGVPEFWEGQVENRARCGKMVILPGQGLFPGCL